MTPTPTKITFGEMRASGVRDVLILLPRSSLQPSRRGQADGWADDVRLSDIEDRFTCTRCGRKGAEVRARIWASQDGDGHLYENARLPAGRIGSKIR